MTAIAGWVPTIGVILNGLQAVKDLARGGIIRPVRIRFTPGAPPAQDDAGETEVMCYNGSK
jgi:hypothetical protein